jgi:hypothetical protein
MKDKTTILVATVFATLVVAVLFKLLPSNKEGFAQQTVGMPIDNSGMGLYDGIDLTSEANMWSSTPKPTPLKPYENADDNQLFQYQNSKFTPECCPSSITSDTGCLCPTKEEERQWLTRGGNRIPM